MMKSWKLGCTALVLGTSFAVACGSGSSGDNPNGAGGEAGGVSSGPEGALSLEHFAFSASNLREFQERLDQLGVDYKSTRQAGTRNIVLNLHDPDGNRLHIDFPASEAKD